jgi:1-acyl-sn-glycerol-3-phosphate acyltransferase
MVSNHISHFDPPFLSGWLPRKIDWIAMAELFGTSWSKASFTWLDVIPVDRHGDDRQALRHALRRLEQGRMIGVFPEGGMRDGAQSILAGADMREGAFLIAAKAGCPVLPVVILGSERLYNRCNWLPWRRAKVYIAVGEPVFPTVEGGRKKLRDDAAAALIRLKNDLFTKCHLTADDLPHSPQERMREP